MIRYIFTTHAHLPGVRLSRPGHWTNLPHDSDADALEAARKDAKGKPFKVERESLTLKLRMAK